MFNLNVQTLKVNDRVGFYRCHRGDIVQGGFGLVTKVNHHGHITVQTENTECVRVYDKHGNERNRDYCGMRLCETSWLEARLEENRKNRELQKAVQAVIQCIESHRCGNGRYHVNSEIKAELARLVAAIEPQD